MASSASSDMRDWCTWTESEIQTLITVWSDTQIQSQLKSAKHNSRVFEVISDKMRDFDIVRTPQQCRNKIKKLKCEWRKVTESDLTSNKRSMGCKYYDLMSAAMSNISAHNNNSGSDAVAVTSAGALPTAATATLTSRVRRHESTIAQLLQESGGSVSVRRGVSHGHGHLADDEYILEHMPDNRSFLEVKLEEDPDASVFKNNNNDGEKHLQWHHRPSRGIKRRRRTEELAVDSESDDDEDDEDDDDDSNERSTSATKQSRREPGAILGALMETFVEAMRTERHAMRQEMSKFEERRIRLENEAELRRLQMEQQHELKMATLLGQIATQIIDSLAKKE